MQTTSAKLYEQSLNLCPGGVHSPVRALKGVFEHPIFFKSAQGAKLVDVEGKEYIDFCQSFGPMILGHRDPDVVAAIESAESVAWSFGACEPYSVELAQFMQDNLAWLEKMRFVSSGTEAVMSTLRLARAVTGREKIIKFEGCYHGHVDSMLVEAGSGLAGESASSSAGIAKSSAEQTLVAKLDNIDSVQEIFKEHGKDIAALIIEPLPANFGLLPQRQEFLQAIAELCRSNDSLLIFDEVISGFRAGFTGMSGRTNISPDLVTYGKIIGGGFPVGCYGGKKEYMDRIAPVGDVYQAGTLSANPMGMIAGLATLKKMQANYEALAEKTAAFANSLNTFFTESKMPYQTVYSDSLFWIRYTDSQEQIRSSDKISKQQNSLFPKIFRSCLEQGVYLSPSAYEVNFLSLAHTDEILESAAVKIKQAFKDAYEA